MPALLLSRFFRARLLASLRPDTLLNLFAPHEGWLKARGIDAQRVRDPEDQDIFNLLSALIEDPDSGLPEDFYLGLERVRKLVLREDLADIFERAASKGFKIAGDPTATDIALSMWLWDARFVEIALATDIPSPNSFVVFRPDQGEIPDFTTSDKDTINTFSKHVCRWLERHKRGDFCDVRIDETDEEVAWTVAHGYLYQVQEILKDGKVRRTLQRPIDYDIIIYRKKTGDLHIHLPRISLKQLTMYRKSIGQYFFGRGNQFSGLSAYDLAPLVHLREHALNCSDIPGIRYVRLEYLLVSTPGKDGSESSFKDKVDFFKALKNNPAQERALFGPDLVPKQARFIFRFKDDPKEYKLTVCVPNKHNWRENRYAHLVEEWLVKRNFLKVEQIREKHEQLEILLPLHRAS